MRLRCPAELGRGFPIRSIKQNRLDIRHYRKPKTSPPDPLSLTGEREIFCLFRRGVKHNNGIILPLSC
ncbi:hypothetical protein CCP3SC1_90007 [Gammaproteobacteria bacterium]